MNYVELKKVKKSLQRLIIGPWTHGGQTRSFAGEAQFTPDAALDFDAWRARWFDHWLKGVDNGVIGKRPSGSMLWGAATGTRRRKDACLSGGTGATNRSGRSRARCQRRIISIRTVPSQRTNRRTSRPPPTHLIHGIRCLHSGAMCRRRAPSMVQGATDQRCRPPSGCARIQGLLSARNDVLVFQTPPLANEVEVTGRLIVKLWAASDSPDTDFTAKLIDVYPPSADFPAGVDLNIGDSIVRARYRKGPGKAELLTPGQPYEFTIEMYPTSLVFMRGHRIRLDISSSNFPRFDVNPNTGEPLNDNRRWRVAENSIYADPQHASHVVLPIIPANGK